MSKTKKKSNTRRKNRQAERKTRVLEQKQERRKKRSLKEQSEEDLGGIMKQKVLSFLRKNPKPSDETVHTWATSQGYEYEEVEEIIYSIASTMVQKVDQLEAEKAESEKATKSQEKEPEKKKEKEPEKKKEKEKVDKEPQPEPDADEDAAPDEEEDLGESTEPNEFDTTDEVDEAIKGVTENLHRANSNKHVPARRKKQLENRLAYLISTKKRMVEDIWTAGRSIDANLTEHDVDPGQLQIGISIEMEHTDDREEAKKIAMDHLAEHPYYYDHLQKMEEEMKKDKRKYKKGAGIKVEHRSLSDVETAIQNVTEMINLNPGKQTTRRMVQLTERLKGLTLLKHTLKERKVTENLSAQVGNSLTPEIIELIKAKMSDYLSDQNDFVEFVAEAVEDELEERDENFDRVAFSDTFGKIEEFAIMVCRELAKTLNTSNIVEETEVEIEPVGDEEEIVSIEHED